MSAGFVLKLFQLVIAKKVEIDIGISCLCAPQVGIFFTPINHQSAEKIQHLQGLSKTCSLFSTLQFFLNRIFHFLQHTCTHLDKIYAYKTDLDLTSPSVRPHNPATRFRPLSATVVSAEPFSYGTETMQCLQKEMATYRHWSVSLWWDPDDVSHCRILSPDKTEWLLISATLCRWRRCFVADHEDAVSWLTNYGSWHAYEKKKTKVELINEVISVEQDEKMK